MLHKPIASTTENEDDISFSRIYVYILFFPKVHTVRMYLSRSTTRQ